MGLFLPFTTSFSWVTTPFLSHSLLRFLVLSGSAESGTAARNASRRPKESKEKAELADGHGWVYDGRGRLGRFYIEVPELLYEGRLLGVPVWTEPKSFWTFFCL